MKRKLILAAIMTMVLMFSMQANATLQNLGTDSLGNRLIYDSDLDITWYDYSNSANTWANQVAWASGLSVTFGSNTYTDWRLPTTTQPDPSCGSQLNLGGGYPLQGYGYNCTGSEIGHLFYTELSNTAGFGLTNTGDFEHLWSSGYWSGTELFDYPDIAWLFAATIGRQDYYFKNIALYAVAVHPGLAVVPEPVSSILFVVGGVSLGFRRFWNKR